MTELDLAIERLILVAEDLVEKRLGELTRTTRRRLRKAVVDGVNGVLAQNGLLSEAYVEVGYSWWLGAPESFTIKVLSGNTKKETKCAV